MIQLFKKSTFYTFWISIIYEGDLCIQSRSLLELSWCDCSDNGTLFKLYLIAMLSYSPLSTHLLVTVVEWLDTSYYSSPSTYQLSWMSDGYGALGHHAIGNHAHSFAQRGVKYSVLAVVLDTRTSWHSAFWWITRYEPWIVSFHRMGIEQWRQRTVATAPWIAGDEAVGTDETMDEGGKSAQTLTFLSPIGHWLIATIFSSYCLLVTLALASPACCFVLQTTPIPRVIFPLLVLTL